MDLRDLTAEFRPRVDVVLEDCAARGVEMRPFFTIRSPHEQARIWRRSRTGGQIGRAIARLRDAGAPWLADVLDGVGPQYGNWGTNALPGQSWHQYGEALDCYWLVDGEVSWDTTDAPDNGYRIYAQEAEANGLTSLGPSIGDWAHIQWRPDAAPAYDWPTIDRMMRERFG